MVKKKTIYLFFAAVALFAILERYFQMIVENKYQGIGLSDFERKYRNAE